MAIDQASPGDRLRQPLKTSRWNLRALASWGLTDVTDLRDASQCQLLAKRRCGCIVTAAGALVAVRGRRWSYRGNLLRAAWDARYASLPADLCELYYHQPLSTPTFLTLSYIHTGSGSSLSTLYAACLVLDEIARLRHSDAIVCHVTNPRISDRLLERWGWQPHCLRWRGRHFIKRFYGKYPPLPSMWAERLHSVSDDTQYRPQSLLLTGS